MAIRPLINGDMAYQKGRIAIRPYITSDELPDKNGAIAGQLLDEA